MRTDFGLGHGLKVTEVLIVSFICGYGKQSLIL